MENMEHKQIAHDLAVAKLYGSNLSDKELIEQYYQFYEQIGRELDSQASTLRTAKIMKSPV